MGIFTRKNKNTVEEKVEIPISQEEKSKIENEISELEIKILKLEDKTELALAYENKGLLLASLNSVDEAIEALERSLDYKLSIKDGYKKLMSLYNKKRSEAAHNGDGEEIEKWMQKMDEMRQIARKISVISE